MSVPNDGSKPELPDIVKEVGVGVRATLERIGEFFHLFDLSFFVSGAATFAALMYWYSRQSIPYVFASATWLRILALIVVCYVIGLLSFSAGRTLAGLWRRGFEAKLASFIEQHNVADNEISRYLSLGLHWRLYERLWADLRESARHAPSFALLNRYWVMAATYDGVGASCLAWAIVLVAEPLLPSGGYTNAVFPSAAVGAAVLSFWQGLNYFRFQVAEMIATLASSRRRLIS